mgnify:CR=1 FL=1
MWLFDRFFSRDYSAHEALWADQLAEQQLEAIQRQLAARCEQLESVAEARGYLRTRANPILRRGLSRVLPEGVTLSAVQQDRVIRKSCNMLSDRLVDGLLSSEAAAVRRQAA